MRVSPCVCSSTSVRIKEKARMGSEEPLFALGVSAAVRFQNKLRKRALKDAFRSLRYGWTINTMAFDFHWSLHQQPRSDPATTRLFRVLARIDSWTAQGRRLWFGHCFRLAKAFDVWWEETGYGWPLWTYHGHVHRRRQAFGMWSAWVERNTILCAARWKAYAKRRVCARVWAAWWQRSLAITTRKVILRGVVLRVFKRWKRRHAALRGERGTQMLATRHVVGACYAKWSKFRGQVKAERAARDLLRDEEQQESARKSPSKRKKKKAKRATVSDLPAIQEDGSAAIVHNLADLKTIEPEDDSAEFFDTAGSSVATALTCVVCFHGASEHAIVPCGHKCLCAECASKFKGPNALCPVCRGPVQQTLKIFG